MPKHVFKKLSREFKIFVNTIIYLIHLSPLALKNPIESGQLRFFFITRYLAAVRLDREPILLGLLPTPHLRSTPSWVPLLCAHLSPCHGSGYKSPVCCCAPDERRNGDHSADHLDVWHVFLGYYFLVDVPLLVFLW